MTMNMRPMAPMEPEHFPEPEAGSNGTGKWILLAVLALAAVFGYRHFAGPGRAMAGWKSDWDIGLQEAERSGKPMLVLFTADWCPPCKQMKSEVLSDPQVASRLRTEFTLVIVDLTQRGGPNQQTANTYGVRSIPTLIRFNENGEQVARLSGGVSREFLLQWLDRRIVIKGR
jgi:thioredoxin 1